MCYARKGIELVILFSSEEADYSSNICLHRSVAKTALERWIDNPKGDVPIIILKKNIILT